MKMTKFHAFLLIFMPTIQATPNTFQKLIISNEVSPCAADKPAKIFPLAEISTVPKCIPDSALCSWKCHMEPNCTCYNFDAVDNQCQLYDYIPTNFVINATCEYFKVSALLDKHNYVN